MSITALKGRFIDSIIQHHRMAKQERALQSAIAHAPTEASRQELLGLHSYLR